MSEKFRMNRKTLFTVIGSFIVIDAIAVAIVLTTIFAKKDDSDSAARPLGEPQPILQQLYPVPNFEFVAQDGTPFGKAQLDGKIWVANVFFTSCAGPCPAMSSNIAALAKYYEPESGVRFVSFIVDPQHDTPPVLTNYAQRHQADPAEWIFLTGDGKQLQDFSTTGLKLGSGDTPLIHSEYFVLIDRSGTVRGYFTGTAPEDVTRLKQGIDLLLAGK